MKGKKRREAVRDAIHLTQTWRRGAGGAGACGEELSGPERMSMEPGRWREGGSTQTFPEGSEVTAVEVVTPQLVHNFLTASQSG